MWRPLNDIGRDRVALVVVRILAILGGNERSLDMPLHDAPVLGIGRQPGFAGLIVTVPTLAVLDSAASLDEGIDEALVRDGVAHKRDYIE